MNFSGGKQANWGGKEAFQELKDMMKALREAANTIQKAGGIAGNWRIRPSGSLHLQLWRDLWCLLNQVYDQLKDEEQVSILMIWNIRP
jgi:hypothetical protein